jgi:hypothetical protein
LTTSFATRGSGVQIPPAPPNSLLREISAYDSHLRKSVTGSAPHGTPVDIVLFQENPVLDYYFVRFEAGGQLQEGWVPEHFIVFEPVA